MVNLNATMERKDIGFSHNIGDIVEVQSMWKNIMVKCRITDKDISERTVIVDDFEVNECYDVYYCEQIEETWFFSNGWYDEYDIQELS